MFIFNKKVDKSLLYVGLTIPVSSHKSVFSVIGRELKRGETAPISIKVEDSTFVANISKYNTEPNMVQIHYGAKSLLAQKLRQVFKYTTSIISQGTESCSDIKENIAVCTTIGSRTLDFECISSDDIIQETEIVSSLSEEEIEFYLNTTDEKAALLTSNKSTKIRRINREIGNSLKILYEYRCQLCGCSVGAEYGAKIAHAHHIVYFSKSINNDAHNLLILCPNHHAIIHDQNPVFDYDSKKFIYANGKTEKLMLNLHL